ncbi:ABC transporter ATP-binding protein [Roseibium sp. Sym1]|uniref:ABC transporter ATP-binding protein n=1 Tax=Roseibium sp. Sym1 TaxID=3016006 RepID=UPI0022B4CF1B|nr:ABC transporter ATP-binding protein [Roseibium sp. Sym1]
MLELENLSIGTGPVPVVRDIDLVVEPGKVTAVLGANGAGKSELVLGVAGVLPVAGGRVRIDGTDVTGMSPDRIRGTGLAAVPEGHQTLTRLSVEDNLLAAGSFSASRDLKNVLEEVFGIFPELQERRHQIAGTLSGGQQQMLAIGHALMARPRYILIDEMSLGLAPLIIKRLVTVVQALTDRNVGVLLVEQFIEVALALADHVVVLRAGEIQLKMTPEEAAADRAALAEAYL